MHDSSYAGNVDVLAPFDALLPDALTRGHSVFYGSSIATPIVAGAIGYVWSRYPKLSADNIRKALFESSIPNNKITGTKNYTS